MTSSSKKKGELPKHHHHHLSSTMLTSSSSSSLKLNLVSKSNPNHSNPHDVVDNNERDIITKSQLQMEIQESNNSKMIYTQQQQQQTQLKQQPYSNLNSNHCHHHLPIVTMLSPRTFKSIDRIPRLEQEDQETMKMIRGHLSNVYQEKENENITNPLLTHQNMRKMAQYNEKVLKSTTPKIISDLYTKLNSSLDDTSAKRERSNSIVKVRGHTKRNMNRRKQKSKKSEVVKNNHNIQPAHLHHQVIDNILDEELTMLNHSSSATTEYEETTLPAPPLEVKLPYNKWHGIERIILNQRLQTYFQKWFNFFTLHKKEEEERQHELENCSTIRIQLLFRRHRAIAELNLRKHIYKLRKEREKKALMVLQEIKRKCAVTIQNKFRQLLAMRRMHRLHLLYKSALRIQCIIRCYISNKIFNLKKKIYVLRSKSAVLIQNRIRIRFAKKERVLQTKIRNVTNRNLLIEKRQHLSWEFCLYSGACIMIQRRFRVYIRRRNEFINKKLIKQQVEFEAASILQNHYRQRLSILFAQRYLGRLKALQAQKISSCILIQSYFRQYLACCYTIQLLKCRQRKRTFALLNKLAEYNTTHTSILLKIPYKRRRPYIGALHFEVSKKVRKRYKKLQRFFVFSPCLRRRENLCATQIQKLYRAYHTRKRIRLLRRTLNRRQIQAKERINQMISQEASLCIQRIWRGFMARGSIIPKLKVEIQIVKIQKHFRRGLSRQYVMVPKLQSNLSSQFMFDILIKSTNNITIQKRCLFLKRCVNSAIILQSWIRIIFSRKKTLFLLLRKTQKNKQQTKGEYEFSETWKLVSAKLLLKSSKSPLKYKGSVQSMFRHWSKTTANSSYRLEGKSFVKIFKEALLMQDGVNNNNRRKRKPPPVTVTDLDLIFAKLKTKGTNYLSYLQFIKGLHAVNELYFQDEVEKTTSTSSSNKFPFHSYLGYTGKEGKLLYMLLEKLYKSPISGGKHQDIHDEITQKLLDSKATIIQSSSRKYLSRILYFQKLSQKEQWKKQRVLVHMSTKLQSRTRILLARNKAIQLAKQRYKKFIDPTFDEKRPYWYDSHTKTTSWDKPKIFGFFEDCETTEEVPKVSQEFIILCSFCDHNDLAQVNCEQCGDSFCWNCFASYHRKGDSQRRNHKALSISFCDKCSFQQSTRMVCMPCTKNDTHTNDYDEKAFLNSKREDTMKFHKLCDTCYCSSQYEKKHITSKKSLSSSFVWLVVKCVECQSNAARWKCLECSDNYCTECFYHLHKHGTRREHTFMRLPYLTPHSDVLQDTWDKISRRKQIRNDNLIFAQQEDLVERTYYAIQIQKMWRGFRGRYFGKLFLRGERRKIRIAWANKKKRKRMKFIL